MSRRDQGADAEGDPGDGHGEAGFAMPLSILAALVIASPVLWASLQGRLDARTGLAAVAVALAGVWLLAAAGSRALAFLDHGHRHQPRAGDRLRTTRVPAPGAEAEGR